MKNKTGDDDEAYVIHCASIVWTKLEANPKVHAVNVDGTANIIGQCVKYRVRKLVSMPQFVDRNHGLMIRCRIVPIPKEGGEGFP